ncbi:MAG: hypothetical protein COA37_12095 [Hoeflea sp.]|nr:MAG: hypothetical protein COA37_12095 [Hoeflea sp.]
MQGYIHPFGFIARDLTDCPSKRIAQVNDSIVVLALRLQFAKQQEKVIMQVSGSGDEVINL